MITVDLRALVGKLNAPCREALQAAIGLAVSRAHYSVEIEHWLLKLLDARDSDVVKCLEHFQANRDQLATDLNRVLDRLKSGNSRDTPFAPQLVQLTRDAWLLSSLSPQPGLIRSGHLLAALLSDDATAAVARETSRQLGLMSGESLRRKLTEITSGSAEDAPATGNTVVAGPAALGAVSGGALDQFTIDLTARARAGKIDPVLGRDTEIRQVIDILTRRRQNNPILTGEAGVGKTAVVEGFALRIAAGDVPPIMQNIAVRTLDLGLLQAGAGVKGEFENRLKSVIEEVKGSKTPIILFIDEAHTLIGAGGAAGQGDAANLLKPALARGDLRTIAATTWAEYKKYFERDAALARRFQVVKVEEPDEAAAIAMLRGMVATLEKHHGVRVLDQAVVEAVRLSKRYIPGRQLPDKGVSVLDTACARVAMSQSAVPAAVEDNRRQIELLTTEMEILERERASGTDHSEAISRLTQTKQNTQASLEKLEARWKEELEVIERMKQLRQQLEGDHAAGGVGAGGNGGGSGGAAAGSASVKLDDAARDRARRELSDERARLAKLQGEDPLLFPDVDGQATAQIIANWTGIPVGRMVSNEIQTVLNLKQLMQERIIGQPDALEAIAQAMRTSRAKLTDPRKPTAVFLMVGTSGVGKTETALTLAELLYGGGQNLSVINMSEFKEEHKVSQLMGSPPGYVGYGEGGVLTEAVRRRPYSVVLLDEMEKAHPGVQDVFYQVFDKGQLRDGEGRDIDFRNTIIIMTSNAGTDTIAKVCADPETMPDSAGLATALRPELLKFFKPAFLGRVTVVPYFPLSDTTLRRIIRLQLQRIQRRVADTYNAGFTYSAEVVESIAVRCTEAESGARNIENVLARGVLPEISARILERLAGGQPIREVRMATDAAAGFSYAFE